MKQTSDLASRYLNEWAVEAAVFTRQEVDALLRHHHIKTDMARCLLELYYSKKEDRHGDRKIEAPPPRFTCDWTKQEILDLKRVANEYLQRDRENPPATEY